MTEPASVVGDATVDRFCIACGYNLRALTSDRCPECGLRLDAAAGAPIPWEARRHIGALRAFWRTVFEATFHPTRLSQAIAFPVNVYASRKFRLVTAILAAIPPAIFLLIIFATNGGTNFLNLWNPTAGGTKYFQPPPYFGAGWEFLVLWSAGALFRFALPVGILVTFLLASGIAQFWVRSFNDPPVRQHRAVAVAGYVFAPFVWMFIPILSVAGGYAAWGYADHTVWMLCVLSFLVGCASLAVIIATYVWNLLALISATFHCGWGRPLLTAIGVAICWALAAVVGLGLFPMLVGLIWLMFDSLRP